MKNFALIGAAGFVAPRHFKAIKDTGNTLVAAIDPHDSVGILDRYFPDARFFTEIERFDRFLEKLRRTSEEARVHYVSVCSPNYLHDSHVRLALRVQAHAICEKPLVCNPWNLDALAALEAETKCNVYNVLQLRLHPDLLAVKRQLEVAPPTKKADVSLTYITRRGSWYHTSWKGQVEKSGGLALNIGVHFFDLLLWFYGRALESRVHVHQPERMAGVLELERARVRWFLSVDGNDLPEGHRRAGKSAYRSLAADGRELEFSDGFTDLHTLCYQEILAGRGVGIQEARPAIELVHRIRNSQLSPVDEEAHPLVAR